MGILSTGIGLGIIGLKRLAQRQGLSEDFLREIDKLEAVGSYADALETAVGDAFDGNGNPNPRFWSDVARDVTAGIVAAEVLGLLAPVASALAPIIFGAASPILGPIFGVVLLAVGAASLGILISGSLDGIGKGIANWLTRLFGSQFFDHDPLVLDLDLGGVSLTSIGITVTVH